MDLKHLLAQIAAEVGDTHEILEHRHEDGVLYLQVGVLGTPRKYYLGAKTSPPYPSEVLVGIVHQLRSNAI